MRSFQGAVWGCALALLAAGAGTTQAAWNNVFQVCCNRCGGSSISAYAPVADPCCTPCPQTVCTTQYVQRCYYQPVTSYQTRTYYQPVTTYQTSYYHEPVTSYRYSYYRDPCTGCCNQVATPVTCYRLRSQCCPVTSYLQRCCLVPTTTYQQYSYYEPVTSCCTTGTGTAAAAPPCNGTPGVIDQRTTPAPGLSDYPSGTGAPAIKQHPDTMPPAGTSNRRQLAPQGPYTPRLAAPQPPVRSPSPPPAVKLDRIVALPGHNIEGRVVRDDRLPHGAAQVLFVSADKQGSQQTVTADSEGYFRGSLASGNWLVYVHGSDGKPVFHSKIEVRDNQPRQFTLVSR